MKILALRALKTAVVGALAIVVAGCWVYNTQDSLQHPQITQFGLQTSPHSATAWIGGSAYMPSTGASKEFLKKYSNGQWYTVDQESGFPDAPCGPSEYLIDEKMVTTPSDNVAWIAICLTASNDTNEQRYNIKVYLDNHWSIMHSTRVTDSSLILRDARIRDNGNAFVLFEGETRDDTGYQSHPNFFFYQRKDEVFSAEEYLLSFQDLMPRNDVVDASAALSEEGNIVAAWSDEQGRIYFTERREGVWIRPVDENDNINPPGNGNSPRVAISANGDALIAWKQMSESNNEFDNIFVSTNQNGQWTHPTTEQRLNPNNAPVALGPVAIDANGDSIVLWRQDAEDHRYFDLLVSEFRDGAWLPADNRLLSSPQGVPYPQVDAHNFRLAMSDNGDAIILWTSQGRIYKSEYRDGHWHRPSNSDDSIGVPGYAVDATDASNWDIVAAGRKPDLVMDEQGNTLVVWSHLFGNLRYIYASDYRNGKWHHPATRDDFVELNFRETDQVFVPYGPFRYDEPDSFPY